METTANPDLVKTTLLKWARDYKVKAILGYTALGTSIILSGALISYGLVTGNPAITGGTISGDVALLPSMLKYSNETLKRSKILKEATQKSDQINSAGNFFQTGEKPDKLKILNTLARKNE